MPISIGDVAGRDVTVARTIDLGKYGDSTVTYYPNRITLEMDVPVDDDEDRDPRGMAEMVCEIVAAWDFEGPVVSAITGAEVVKRGDAVPLAPEPVSAIPYPILSALYRGILQREANPNARKPKRSR